MTEKFAQKCTQNLLLKILFILEIVLI